MRSHTLFSVIHTSEQAGTPVSMTIHITDKLAGNCLGLLYNNGGISLTGLPLHGLTSGIRMLNAHCCLKVQSKYKYIYSVSFCILFL
jgi:hypothetical protein